MATRNMQSQQSLGTLQAAAEKASQSYVTAQKALVKASQNHDEAKRNHFAAITALNQGFSQLKTSLDVLDINAR